MLVNLLGGCVCVCVLVLVSAFVVAAGVRTRDRWSGRTSGNHLARMLDREDASTKEKHIITT